MRCICVYCGTCKCQRPWHFTWFYHVSNVVQMAPEERRPVTEDGEAASTLEAVRPDEEEVERVRPSCCH